MLWAFHYDPQTQKITGRVAGDKLRKWVGSNFYGEQVQALYPRGELFDLLIKIVTAPLACRSSGRLFTVGDFVVTGERIALPLAADGETGDGIFGASDYVPPPLLGTPELVHENLEWYSI